MKEYIAYGTNGKNLFFERKKEIEVAFNLHDHNKLYRHIERGTPITHPATGVIYYIDQIDKDWV